MNTNPLEDFEKQLRAAVVAVNDLATYREATSIIHRATSANINSQGKESKKSSLNFAINAVIRYSLSSDTTAIDLYTLRLKLSVIDLLLFNGAQISALEHPDTKKLMNFLTKKTTEIFSTMLKNRQEPNLESKKIIALSYAINQQLSVAKSLNDLKAECAGIIPQRIDSKILVVCECHEDLGSTVFLQRLKDDLVKSGYTNLCLEYCDDLTKTEYSATNSSFKSNTRPKSDANFLPLSQFASQDEFRDNVVVIDAVRINESSDPMAPYKYHCFIELIGPSIFKYVRENYMILSTMLRARQHEGKVVLVIGAGHGEPIISALKNIGIDCLSVAPFLNPDNLQLLHAGQGASAYRPKESNAFKELFTKHGCQPFNMKDSSIAQALKEFVTENFLLPATKKDIAKLRFG